MKRLVLVCVLFAAALPSAFATTERLLVSVVAKSANPADSPYAVEAPLVFADGSERLILRIVLHSQSDQPLSDLRLRAYVRDNDGQIIGMMNFRSPAGLEAHAIREIDVPIPNGFDPARSAQMTVVPIGARIGQEVWGVEDEDLLKFARTAARFRGGDDAAEPAVPHGKRLRPDAKGCSLFECRDFQVECQNACHPMFAFACSYCDRRADSDCQSACYCVALNQPCPPNPFQ